MKLVLLVMLVFSSGCYEVTSHGTPHKDSSPVCLYCKNIVRKTESLISVGKGYYSHEICYKQYDECDAIGGWNWPTRRLKCFTDNYDKHRES